MFILESPRLTFRHLAPGDLNDLAALHADAEVMRFLGGVRTRDASWESLQRIRRSYSENRFGLYAAVLKSDGKFIGRCGFIRWNIDDALEIEVAYALAREYWGKRLATEAAQGLVRYGFRVLKAPRLISLIHPENNRSIHLAEKAGLKFEREVMVNGVQVRLHAISA